MNDLGYLRQPTLAGEAIVFVCDDDLWRVDAGGGIARRLTAGLGEPSSPMLSRDGKWLAYVSRDEQHPEVFLMPGEGGPARRMTWLGANFVNVLGFTPAGRILLSTPYGQPHFRYFRAWTLDLDGGLPERLPLGQVNHLSFAPQAGAGDAPRPGALGPCVIGRNTGDPARWKRYRGGTAGHLWIDATGSGEFQRLSPPQPAKGETLGGPRDELSRHPLAGNLTCPMWLGARVYFLSDAEGVGNLYSMRPDGTDLRRHTDHDDFYARFASTDGARIVYQCGAAIWCYDPTTDRTRALDIRVPAHRTQAARRFVDAGEQLAARDALDPGFTLHPAGHSVALDVRGQAVTLALWEGAVRRHDGAPGRRRGGQWLADGSTFVCLSDASGEERLEVRDAQGMRTLDTDLGRVIRLLAAPVGTRVALANHRHEVLIVDVADGTLQHADRSAAGRTEDLAWSPDGAWLAYPFWTSPRACAIKLYEVATRTATVVTRPEFRDWSPSFDPDGRFLYFLSVRTFDPVYDNVQFELSFPRAARPYLIALAKDAPPPFEPLPKGLGPDAAKAAAPGPTDTAATAAAASAGAAAGAAPAPGTAAPDAAAGAAAPGTAPGVAAGAPRPLRVDLDSIAQRIAAFPVAEGRYGRIAGIGGGKVLWTQEPIPGAHGRGGHPEGPAKLEQFDFATAKVTPVADKVHAFALSADTGTLLLRNGRRLRALAAGSKAEDGDETPSRATGWLDLGRVRVDLDPRAEWRQMLREIWRLQRDNFWVEDMSGVDWAAVYARYAPLVERVSTRGELSDLVWEMQGELGTSHAYEMGGDHRRPPALALGHLAADLRWSADGRGYEIVGVVNGDAWDAESDSPLNAVGVLAQPGERILAVNGRAVSRELPPQALLVHQARQKAELELLRPDGSTRRAVVRLLADETPARYRAWVEANRRFVHQRSDGRVGYFHVPDMQSAGFAEFHRYFAAECDRAALIVDVRFNRGGHVSQLLLEKVARKRIGYDLQRWGPPQPYPGESPAGPLVALTNEHAGSDGDIFSHCFKLMQLGPLVGKRTWGGVIGIWPRHRLADGTETTQPEFSFWFEDVGWQVENYGTDPDVDLDNPPQDDAPDGRDSQLERALALALALARDAAPVPPDFGPRPHLARRPLPPRPRDGAGG